MVSKNKNIFRIMPTDRRSLTKDFPQGESRRLSD